MPSYSDRIQAARSAGYSDDEIASSLQKDPVIGDRLKTALDHGYKATEVLGRIASSPQAVQAIADQKKADIAKQYGHYASNQENNTQPSNWSLSGAWNALSSAASGMLHMATLPITAPLNPMKTQQEAEGLVQAQLDQFKQAKQDYQYGEPIAAAGHALAGTLPMVGPMAAQTGQQIHDKKYSEGLTNAGILLAPSALKIPIINRGAEAVLNKVASAANVNIKLPSSLSPERVAARDFAINNGIPLDAAAQTGNSLVRSTQELAQTTPGASGSATRAIASRNAGFTRVGRELAEKVSDQPATPESAGAAIRSEAESNIRGANTGASGAYERLQKIEQDPANVKQVQVGTKTVTSSVLDSSGKPITQDVPITKDVALPVDMKPYKAAMQPLYDDIKRRISLGQSQYAPALMAVEDLIKGDDVVPSSVAEKNLGALKMVSRDNTLAGGVKNSAGALAAKSVGELQRAIDGAVGAASPDALNELRTGRMETASKYEAIKLVDDFRAEPVKLYNQLVESRDGGINFLRQVQKQAPTKVSLVGRAFLDGMLDRATESGGFDHADKMYADWRKMGPETKQILFKDKSMVSDLDNFFQAAKDSARVENPSGTAKVSHLATSGAMVITHPLIGIPYMIAGNALSRLMYNPAFVRAATKGFRISLSASKPAAALAASKILYAAGSDAKPLTGASAQ